MNSVYVETASRIYAAFLATPDDREPSELAGAAFELASSFMKEYQKRSNAQAAEMQQIQQQYPGAVMGRDPLEIRTR
jgi:hypothetical protein